MRLRIAPLLVALSTLPFTLRDSGAQEPEKPVKQDIVEVSDILESNLIRARGGLLPRPKNSVQQSQVPQVIRRFFDRSFTDADVRYIIREFDNKKIIPVDDYIEKAKVYGSIANKFHVRYSGEGIVALFVNLKYPEIIGDEKDPAKAAELINDFSELVNKDLGVKIPPYAFVEMFKVLKQHNLFETAKSPSEVAEIMKHFNEKVFKYNKNDLPQLLDHLLSTYYVSDIQGYKEKADAMGKLNDLLSTYNTNPENMQTLINGLAWSEYIDGISEKSPVELAKSIIEKVEKYKFSPFLSVMFVRNGVDPDYANEYLEKAKEKIPYDLPIGQLILFKVPLEFYLKHESHDPSVVIHDYNETKIRDLLKASGIEDIDKAIKEMKAMNTHFGLAFPENYVKSYLAVKSMEDATAENCKLDKIILFLLPDYKPGHDSSTRNDSAFMFSAFPIRDLEKLGFTVILSTYENDFDIERIANEVSGNYNCTPGVEWPFTGMVVAGHGKNNGSGLFISDIPYDPGFDEKKQASSVLDINDVGIFEKIGECFKPNSPVALVFCACSAAYPLAEPKNLITFASEELPGNFLIQGPTLPTVIYGAHKRNKTDELPSFIFDGWRAVKGKK